MILARARAWLTRAPGTHRARTGRHDIGGGRSIERWKTCDPPEDGCVYLYDNDSGQIIGEHHCARHGGPADVTS